MQKKRDRKAIKWWILEAKKRGKQQRVDSDIAGDSQGGGIIAGAPLGPGVDVFEVVEEDSDEYVSSGEEDGDHNKNKAKSSLKERTTSELGGDIDNNLIGVDLGEPMATD